MITKEQLEEMRNQIWVVRGQLHQFCQVLTKEIEKMEKEEKKNETL